CCGIAGNTSGAYPNIRLFLGRQIYPNSKFVARNSGPAHGCLVTLTPFTKLKGLCSKPAKFLSSLQDSAHSEVSGNLRFPLTITYHGCPTLPVQLQRHLHLPRQVRLAVHHAEGLAVQLR